MNKFLLTLELRYTDAPKYKDDDCCQYISEKITMGIFDTEKEAILNGNNILEILENKFSLNEFTKRKDRLNNKIKLVGNLGYLNTPFTFYLKITTLKFNNIEIFINKAIEATKRYKDFKDSEI